MRYALVFDAHIGRGGWEKTYPALRRAVDAERERGAQIVWAGDTLDWYVDRNAAPPEGLVLPGDWWMPGNHDPEALPGLEARWWLVLDGVFVTHGDAVDLQWALTLLGRLTGGRIRREHALSLYRLLAWGPDWAMRRLEAWFWAFLRRPMRPDLGALLAFLPFLPAVLLSRPPGLFPEPGDPILGLGDLVTHKPDLLAARIEVLFPEAKDAHTLVMGHLHRPLDVRLPSGKRLVVSGCWVYGAPLGYVAVEDGEAYLIPVSL